MSSESFLNKVHLSNRFKIHILKERKRREFSRFEQAQESRVKCMDIHTFVTSEPSICQAPAHYLLLLLPPLRCRPFLIFRSDLSKRKKAELNAWTFIPLSQASLQFVKLRRIISSFSFLLFGVAPF